MFSGLIWIVVSLSIYWLLWKLYIFFASRMSSDSTPKYIRSPSFLQFAFVAFFISVLLRKNK